MTRVEWWERYEGRYGTSLLLLFGTDELFRTRSINVWTQGIDGNDNHKFKLCHIVAPTWRQSFKQNFDSYAHGPRAAFFCVASVFEHCLHLLNTDTSAINVGSRQPAMLLIIKRNHHCSTTIRQQQLFSRKIRTKHRDKRTSQTNIKKNLRTRRWNNTTSR